ncbi:MAG: zinc-binding dehydrogenase [Thermodesulfobacteriota bacterium]|nr:zinc-binding dehydrogenase [Thermodesulfobacteriota bacterium]
MKAAQIVGPRKIEIIDAKMPDMSKAPPGSLLIKTEYSAICGSDMPHFAYELPIDAYPLPSGFSIHECIGTVFALNSNKFKPGDAVLSLPYDNRGLANYFLSHEDKTVLLPEYEDKNAILMSQPLGTVIWAMRKLGNILNYDAVVVGQGPMGLLITHILSNLGAKRVIALDRLDYRLEVSKKMRATHTINIDKESAQKVICDITQGSMADLVVEAVGHQIETLNQCLDMVKDGGTILAFGVPDEEVYPLFFRRLFYKNISLIGSVHPEVKLDFPLAMDMITQERIGVSPIITHTMPFKDVQKGFEMFLNKTHKAIKIVLNHESR